MLGVVGAFTRNVNQVSNVGCMAAHYVLIILQVARGSEGRKMNERADEGLEFPTKSVLPNLCEDMQELPYST